LAAPVIDGRDRSFQRFEKMENFSSAARSFPASVNIGKFFQRWKNLATLPSFGSPGSNLKNWKKLGTAPGEIVKVLTIGPGIDC